MLDDLDWTMAVAQTSKTLMPVRVRTGSVFAHTTIVFPYEDLGHFALLSSSFHYRWATRFSASMRTDARYIPSDCFETFVQPSITPEMLEIGELLDARRKELMESKSIGLTELYNLVHDPTNEESSISRLRVAHRDLDRAVSSSYNWDLDLEYGFYEVRGQGIRFTLAPALADEVLDRLLELNKQRYTAETAAGLQKSAKRKRTSTTPKAPSGQGSLLGDRA